MNLLIKKCRPLLLVFIAALGLANGNTARAMENIDIDEITEASQFPEIFDPALWDIDPQTGNAIEGTDFADDGGRRQGILQLFIFNTLNLKNFLTQQEQQVQDQNLSVENGVATLTRNAPQTQFLQTLENIDGETIHTGKIVFNGTTVVDFTHNLTTDAFDGEYRSPADRDTRHRAISLPLADGNFILGSAYDLLNNGKANYTHIGLFDNARQPLRLLEFFQVNRAFEETSLDLENKVTLAAQDQANGDIGGGAEDEVGEDDPDEGDIGDVDDGDEGGDTGEDDDNGADEDNDIAQFPAIFDPALWDIDPQIGNAIDSTEFANDGGRRQGILQLFIFNTLNLKAFIDQQEAQVQSQEVEIVNGAATLTRIAPQATFVQTLEDIGGQTVHTGNILFNGNRIVSFTHNLTTGAFDGEYRSPADRDTRHRAISQPLADGNFILGSAYDLLNNGKANYTHIGLFDSERRPLQLLEFFQINRAFEETSLDLENKVDLAVQARGGAGIGDDGGNEGDAGDDLVDSDDDADNGDDDVAAAFPALLDIRLFQLNLAAVGAPGNSGNIFGVVNAVARNAIDDLQRFIDSSEVSIETDASGRLVEIRAAQSFGASFESRQTFENGIQEATLVVNGSKRMQFIHDHNTGAYKGVIIAPDFDRNAPLVSIITPNGDGTSNHVIVEDLANNLTNDYIGELVVDSDTFEPLRFVFFEQFNGGLAAQPASNDLVREFDFSGIIKGF